MRRAAYEAMQRWLQQQYGELSRSLYGPPPPLAAPQAQPPASREVEARWLLMGELLYVPGVDEEVMEVSILEPGEPTQTVPATVFIPLRQYRMVFKRTATPAVLGYFEYDLLGERTA